MTNPTGREALALLESRLQSACPSMKMTRNAVMAQYTTLRLGGPADLLAEPATPDMLQTTLALAKEAGVPVTVIGQGSNLLVLDGGVRGLVVRVGREMNNITVSGTELVAEAGASLASVAQAAAEHDLAGLAFAGGIPGTAGGGAYMNAGAYGGEMKQVVAWAEGYRMDGTPVHYSAGELEFGYRTSRLHRENVVLSRVCFCLTPGNRADIIAEMQELNRKRADKQPLTLPSAGSTFKRPEGYFAAALIEECGLKGVTIGGAQVSEKHSGFCVNRGGTAADFLALIAHVQRVVLEEKGVQLETEVKIIGEETAPGAV